MARQGHASATTELVRVIRRPIDGEEPGDELVDVPWDGETMGEIATRGNLVMKEVALSDHMEQ